MSDITAVVLTLGEETTARALASIARQSTPPRETVVVSDTTPFHRALNLGASRVGTEFFVQVDADMVLDPDCFRALRDCAGDRIGIVAGHLRDPLIGRVSAVKLFRTECFRRARFGDSISPDTDFIAEIREDGWGLVYALRYEGDIPELWHTFGEHQPDYALPYAFFKHMLEGRRYRYRNDRGALIWHLGRLGQSGHPAAGVAAAGLALGLFLEAAGDLLSRPAEHPEFSRLEKALAARPGRPRLPLALWLAAIRPPLRAFEDAYRLGVKMRKKGVGLDVHAILKTLAKRALSWTWPSFVGLCRGTILGEFDYARFDEDRRILEALIQSPPEQPRFRRLPLPVAHRPFDGNSRR